MQFADLDDQRGDIEPEDDEDEDDDYIYDMDQFGEEEHKNESLETQNRLIKVVTNRKGSKSPEERSNSNWDFNAGFSQDLFSGPVQNADGQNREECDGELDDDSLGETEQSPPLTSKMGGAPDSDAA